MCHSPNRGGGRGGGENFKGSYFPGWVVGKWKCRSGKVSQESSVPKRGGERQGPAASAAHSPLSRGGKPRPAGSPLSQRHLQDSGGWEDSCA